MPHPADAAVLRILDAYARAVEALLAAVGDDEPVRALAAWRDVESKTAFVRHLLEDIGERKR